MMGGPYKPVPGREAEAQKLDRHLRDIQHFVLFEVRPFVDSKTVSEELNEVTAAVQKLGVKLGLIKE